MNLDLNWRRLAVWFGVVALADAVLMVLPLPIVPTALERAVPPVVVPVLALVAAALAGRTLLRSGGEAAHLRERPRQLRDDDDEGKTVGADVDEALEALGADGSNSEWTRANAARTLRSELRRATRDALVTKGHTLTEAHRLVETGAWTDDRRASAFLGEERLPLWMRVSDWASGAGEARRAEAAAEELLALVEGGTSDEEAVEPTARRRRARGNELADVEVEA